MKKLIFIAAFVSNVSLFYAQTSEKPVRVHIKKVENINGVETIKDTSYIVNETSALKLEEADVNINWTDESGSEKKVIRIKECDNLPEIIIDNQEGGPVETLTISSIDEATGKQQIRKIVINDPSGEMNQEEIMRHLDEKMKELDIDMKSLDGKMKQAVFIDANIESIDGDKENKTTRVIIIKKILLTEPSEEDTKMLSRETGISDEKLNVDNINFYPNPNNGKFTLDFTLPEKGNTVVNILNVEGKSVYKEELKNFSGKYQHEIDISSNPKGIYFVRINQGKHAQVKKIILE